MGAYLRRLISVSILLALITTPSARAQTPEEETYTPRVLITEVQTESESSATEEFIELTNISELSVDITGWEVEYKSAAGTSWTKKAELAGTLYPEGSVIITSITSLLEAGGLEFSGGLATTPGGHVRLVWQNVDTTWVVEDKVGWGTANEPEATAAASPLKPNSLSRKIDEHSKYIDTDNNFLDFEAVTPNPRADNPEPAEETPPAEEEPVEEAPPEENEQEEAPEEAENQNEQPETPERSLPAIPIRINELMIDPASPETDKMDEWIELYNPNEIDIDLAGYRLQTGSTFSYTYVLPELTIAAHGFVSFSSGQSNLVLSNTAGAVRLLDFDGGVMDILPSYNDVQEGETYAFDGSSWSWTNTLTRDADNIITRPVVLPKVLKTAAKKVTTAKSASAKAASVKKPTTKKTAEREVYEVPGEIETTPPLHPGVLAGAGAIAVIYAVYEYRQDIRNTYRRLRSYLRFRRASWAKTKGR